MSGITTAVALSAAVFVTAWGGSALEARRAPQDAAGKLSGTWVLNRELSSGFGASGPGRGGAAPRPLFAMAGTAQRGGGGGGGGVPSDAADLTPEQRAEQAAMRRLQQIDPRVTITASATAVTFTDSGGERTFPINDKNETIFVVSSPVKVKTRWDKQVLKQEFTNPQAKLVRTWTVDSTDRLILSAKLESLRLITPERRAVFDRQ